MTTTNTAHAAADRARDCTCLTVHHEHGTVRAYKVDRCRCRPCTDAVAAYQRDVAKARALRESQEQAAVTADLARLDRERQARARSYATVAAADREARARLLLASGCSAGQVAMQTGMPLAAVDRLAGRPTTVEQLSATVDPRSRQWAQITPHVQRHTEDPDHQQVVRVRTYEITATSAGQRDAARARQRRLHAGGDAA